MKKASLVIVLLLLFNFVFAQKQTQLVSYIPDDNEIKYYMNLYERLKSIELNQNDSKQLESMFSSFENKEGKYYMTYQRFLFESYLLYTHNATVKKQY